MNIPQDKVLIGLPVLRSERESTLSRLIRMPVTAGHPAEQRPAKLMKRDEPQELPRTVLADGIAVAGIPMSVP